MARSVSVCVGVGARVCVSVRERREGEQMIE